MLTTTISKKERSLTFSDFTCSYTFKCDDNILSIHSRYFEAMLFSSFKESSENGIQIIVDFMDGVVGHALEIAFTTGKIPENISPYTAYILNDIFDRFICSQLAQDLLSLLRRRFGGNRTPTETSVLPCELTKRDVLALYTLSRQLGASIVSFEMCIPDSYIHASYMELYTHLQLDMSNRNVDADLTSFFDRLNILQAWATPFRENKDTYRLSLVDVFRVPSDLYTCMSIDPGLVSIPPLIATIPGELAGIPNDINTFKHVFDTFSFGLFNEHFDWSNIVVAGGSIQACLLPGSLEYPSTKDVYTASDIDIFIFCKSGIDLHATYTRLIQYFSMKNAYFGFLRCGVVTICIPGIKRNVQLICATPHQTLASLLYNFDMSNLQCAYDGTNVMATPACLIALCTRVVFMSRTVRSYRIWKTVKKGFGLYLGAPNIPDTPPDDIFRYCHVDGDESPDRILWLMKLLLRCPFTTRDPSEMLDHLYRFSLRAPSIPHNNHTHANDGNYSYIYDPDSSIDLRLNFDVVIQMLNEARINWTRSQYTTRRTVERDLNMVLLPQPFILVTDIIYASCGYDDHRQSIRLCFQDEYWESDCVQLLHLVKRGVYNFMCNHIDSLPAQPLLYDDMNIKRFGDIEVKIFREITEIWDVISGKSVDAIPRGSGIKCWIHCSELWYFMDEGLLYWGIIFNAQRIDIYPPRFHITHARDVHV